MTELFADAYSGEVLSVSYTTDAIIRQSFPHIDVQACYKAADAYLLDCPKSRWPRNRRRFLINWAKREQACTLRNAEAWRLRQEAYEREIGVGGQQ